MAITNTLVSLGNYEYYEKFTTDFSPGGGQDTTTWVCPSGVRSVQYLVVAGGGSGGSGYVPGGGGAGGLRTGTLTVVPGQSYTIKVGAGGASVKGTGNSDTSPSGNSGAASQFDTITVNGGGYGAGRVVVNGGSGGCGGGASGSYNLTHGAVGGTGNPGYKGGNCDVNYAGGSGGGGMGGVGQNGSVTCSYPNTGVYTSLGGAGVVSTITGSSVTYCKGGNGHRHPYNSNGPSGAANTGNGGDAGTNYDCNKTSGAGGSGIVILRYAESKMLVRGGREWLL